MSGAIGLYRCHQSWGAMSGVPTGAATPSLRTEKLCTPLCSRLHTVDAAMCKVGETLVSLLQPGLQGLQGTLFHITPKPVRRGGLVDTPISELNVLYCSTLPSTSGTLIYFVKTCYFSKSRQKTHKIHHPTSFMCTVREGDMGSHLCPQSPAGTDTPQAALPPCTTGTLKIDGQTHPPLP